MGDKANDETFADTDLFKLALSDANHVQTAGVIQSTQLDEPDDLNDLSDKSNRHNKPIVMVKLSPLRNFICFVIGTIVGALGLLTYAWNREAITEFVTKIFG